MKTIYLDYNATTPVDEKVLQAMLPYFTEKFGNASSKTHQLGWIAEQAVTTARQQVAKIINAEEQEIIFTSGATEAINTAIKGIFEAYKQKGNHIIALQSEHKAVLDTCKYLEKKGATVTYLPVGKDGRVDLDELKKAITPATILVCIMFANNETGVIQPMIEISEIVHQHNSILMSDATQAVGKINVDVQDAGIDVLCLSAHKLYGPKGAGALYIRRKNPRVTILPLIHGGGHERGIRSGTLNVPAIVGLGQACEIATERMWEDGQHLSIMRTMLEQKLTENGNAFINGDIKNRLPHVTNITFKGIKADKLISRLPHIAISTGSACTSAIAEPSHVLKAMGLSDEDAYASVRLSLGRYTTGDDIETAIRDIGATVKLLKEEKQKVD